MSCGASHLGFPIGIKNIKFVEDLPMIIPGHFAFNCPSVDNRNQTAQEWSLEGPLQSLCYFYADRKFKMATTAGHRLTLDPMGKYSNAAAILNFISEKKT
jgi:hypothetical protein